MAASAGLEALGQIQHRQDQRRADRDEQRYQVDDPGVEREGDPAGDQALVVELGGRRLGRAAVHALGDRLRLRQRSPAPRRAGRPRSSWRRKRRRPARPARPPSRLRRSARRAAVSSQVSALREFTRTGSNIWSAKPRLCWVMASVTAGLRAISSTSTQRSSLSSSWLTASSMTRLWMVRATIRSTAGLASRASSASSSSAVSASRSITALWTTSRPTASTRGRPAPGSPRVPSAGWRRAGPRRVPPSGRPSAASTAASVTESRVRRASSLLARAVRIAAVPITVCPWSHTRLRFGGGCAAVRGVPYGAEGFAAPAGGAECAA